MSRFVLNVPPNRNFGDAIAVQDLKVIHVWNFFRCFPIEQKAWRRPCIRVQYIYIYIYIYIYTVLFMLSLVPPSPQIFKRGGPHVISRTTIYINIYKWTRQSSVHNNHHKSQSQIIYNRFKTRSIHCSRFVIFSSIDKGINDVLSNRFFLKFK